MAAVSPESRILSRIKNDHLTCRICHGPYILPKALPCLHTFCSQCLQDFVFSRRYEPGGEFPCPVCRVPVKLTKHGVDAFPDNHLVVTLMDTVAGERCNLDHKLDQTVVLSIDEPVYSTVVPQDQRDLPTADTQPPPSTGLYPRLTPLLERKMQDVQTPRRIVFDADTLPPAPSNNTQPQPKPRRTAPPSTNSRGTTSPPRHVGYNTPTILPTSQVPVQRKLSLSTDQYPILIEKNRHGAIVSFGQYGSGLADFDKPVGLAISPEGYVIVGDQRGNRVFIFECTGKLRTMFTCQGMIQDVATNKQGLIYIANTHARKSMVVCYNTRGHTVATFGNFFTYEKPHGIAVMSDNHMIITSIETHLAYVLNEYGKMTHKFTGKGKDGKRLNHPYHVAVSRKDKIIISDHGNDTIKIFDNHAGKCKVQFGKTGAKPGQLNGPRGVCVDRDNNILVADSRNHRIQAFTSRGQFIRVVMQLTSVDLRVGAACPINVAITQENKLVVLLAGASYAQVRIYPYVI